MSIVRKSQLFIMLFLLIVLAGSSKRAITEEFNMAGKWEWTWYDSKGGFTLEQHGKVISGHGWLPDGKTYSSAIGVVQEDTKVVLAEYVVDDDVIPGYKKGHIFVSELQFPDKNHFKANCIRGCEGVGPDWSGTRVK
jgi:hypothetical protein